MIIKERISKLFGEHKIMQLKMPEWFGKALKEARLEDTWNNPVIRERFYKETGL